ncbi:calcium-binding protein, partial [Falsiruegeria mediterranea]
MELKAGTTYVLRAIHDQVGYGDVFHLLDEDGNAEDAPSIRYHPDSLTAYGTHKDFVLKYEADTTLYFSVRGAYGTTQKYTFTLTEANLAPSDAQDNMMVWSSTYDVFDGGDGIDTLSFAHLSNPIELELFSGIISGQDITQPPFRMAMLNIEIIEGTQGDDRLVGDYFKRIHAPQPSISKSSNISEVTWLGLDGNDTLGSTAGATIFNGGSGIDTADYSGASDGTGQGNSIDVSLLRRTGLHGAAEGDQLISIENLIGSSFDDTLTGDHGDNLLNGGDGIDRLMGLGGDDTLDGGTRPTYGWQANPPPPSYLDRAVFRYDRDEYTVTVIEDADNELSAIVDNVGGDGSDGRDVVRNIAWLEFADQAYLIGSFVDAVPGAPNLGNPVMTVGDSAPMRVDFPGDTDTYAIDLEAGQTYQLSLEGGGYISQNLYTLIAPDGSEMNLFGQGWDGYGNPHLTRSFHFEATETGRYHLQYTSPPDSGGFDTDYGYTVSDPFSVVIDHGANTTDATSGDDVFMASDSGSYVNGLGGQDRFVADISFGGVNVSHVQWAGYFSETAGEAPTFYLDQTVGTGPDGQRFEAKHDIQVTQVETFVGTEYTDFFSVRSQQGYRHTDRVYFEGRGGDDIFESTLGPNHFDGGVGIDAVNYRDAWFVSDESRFVGEGIRVDLAAGTGHGGAAEGDTYTSIERVIGSERADVLIAGSNTTELHGGNGNDWLLAGPNGHYMNGNGGSNTASFVNLQDTLGRAATEFRLRIDLEAGKAHSHDPSQVYDLNSIDRATGTIYADLLRGDEDDNELRGLGDYDWFIATEGNDTLDGGNGRDMVTFIEAENSGAAT